MRLVGMICCALLLSPLPSLGERATPAGQPPATFASAKWGIALEYPAGWSVDDDGDEVTFRPAHGDPVVLGRSGTDNPSDPAPGRRTPKPPCSTTTTAHDVAATVCFDPASLTRRAVLVVKTRDGVPSRFVIRTHDRDPQIIDAMVSSVRRYP